MQPRFRTQRDKTPFDKLAQAFARTRLGGWLFVHVFPVTAGGQAILDRQRQPWVEVVRSSWCG